MGHHLVVHSPVVQSVAFSLRIRASTDLNDAVCGRNTRRHLFTTAMGETLG